MSIQSRSVRLQYPCPSHWPALPERQSTEPPGKETSPAAGYLEHGPRFPRCLCVPITLYAIRYQAALNHQQSPGLRSQAGRKLRGNSVLCLSSPLGRGPRDCGWSPLVTQISFPSSLLSAASTGSSRLLPVLFHQPLLCLWGPWNQEQEACLSSPFQP